MNTPDVASPPAPDADLATWEEFLNRFRQTDLLRFWNELTAAGRAQLVQQLTDIDWEQLQRLLEAGADSHDWSAISRQAVPPVAVRLTDRVAGDGSRSDREQEADRLGRDALATGKVGVIVTAGGQGSRLGFDKPKGLFPIGPVSGASLLQIHLRKVSGLTARYGKPIPVYLMTSPATDTEQRAYLEENDYFGLPREDVHIFCQGTMPAVDAASGSLLLGAKDSLFLSPDGHGGMVEAIAKSGALDDMEKRGIESLFYLQVDNPLVPIGDASMLGYHYLANSELTSMAVAKQLPQDKVGNFVTVGDRLQVIEYSDFPDDVAEKTNEDGSLMFWAGSIAVHIFSVSFLRKSLAMRDSLPFHTAHKKVPYIDHDGSMVEPTAPNALKFERFIFDLLPHAQNPLVVEFEEFEVFAPLKNAPGAAKDTAEYVQKLLVRQHTEWLVAAGVSVAEGVAVEIDPRWAFDAEVVADRVEPGMAIDEAIYLGGRG